MSTPTRDESSAEEIIDCALSNLIEALRTEDVDPQYAVDARHILLKLRKGELALSAAPTHNETGSGEALEPWCGCGADIDRDAARTELAECERQYQAKVSEVTEQMNRYDGLRERIETLLRAPEGQLVSFRDIRAALAAPTGPTTEGET